MKRLFRPFRRLQWKLTFSYVWITVVTQVLLELVILIFIVETGFGGYSSTGVDVQRQEAAQIAPYLSQTPSNRAELDGWLRGSSTSLAPLPVGDFNVVVDEHGLILASVGATPAPVGTSLFNHLSPQTRASLQAALAGNSDPQRLTSKEADGLLVTSVPIVGKDHKVVGALMEKSGTANRGTLLLGMGLIVLLLAIPSSIFATIIGTIFGFLTARSFTRRIKRLFLAADNWSRGNFSASVTDASSDELGQLAQRLNSMAEQLQNLLHTRQKLASLEERNRLARDLHDSVKQQVFAVAMQVRAAKTLLKVDVDEVQDHLNEAEQLVHQAQQELTSLVLELRPIALEGRGLAVALREHVTDWSRRTSIAASLQVEDEQALPFPYEEALFRVAQEALANVERHSNATSVYASLLVKKDSLRLAISDNGKGFNTSVNTSSGVGLRSMRERIKELGGLIEIKSEAGGGTSIMVSCEHVNTNILRERMLT